MNRNNYLMNDTLEGQVFVTRLPSGRLIQVSLEWYEPDDEELEEAYRKGLEASETLKQMYNEIQKEKMGR